MVVKEVDLSKLAIDEINKKNLKYNQEQSN